MERKQRSMWPKEHGAYAQLGLPLLTALACGRPTIASLLFVVSAIAAFVSHEPGALLLGIRGTRARRENEQRARVWLGVTGAIALGTGVLGLVLAPRAVPFAAAALTVAAATSLLLYEHKERTHIGEIIASTALAGAAAPVGAASGLSTWAILACWAAWAAQSAVSTVAVHALVQKRGAWPTLLAAGLVVGAATLVRWPIALAVLPTCAVCVAVAVSKLTVKSIRSIGYALACAMIASGASLAASVRVL